MPVSKALLGENVHSELLSSTTHRQQSNKEQSRKNIDFRFKKNEKYLKAIILLSTRHSSPTLYGSKPAQKAEVGLCLVFLGDVWQEVAVLSLCLDRSYRESTVTVRCFFLYLKNLRISASAPQALYHIRYGKTHRYLAGVFFLANKRRHLESNNLFISHNFICLIFLFVIAFKLT